MLKPHDYFPMNIYLSSVEGSGDVSLLTMPFCANIASVSCLAKLKGGKKDYIWNRETCQVMVYKGA